MILSQNPRAYEYLLAGIASSRSVDELARMRQLAHAHYSGAMLRELEAEIELRSRDLMNAPPPVPPAIAEEEEPPVRGYATG